MLCAHRSGRGRSFLAGAVVGAVFAELFDPERGRRRRERAAGAVRHGEHRAARAGRATVLQVFGRARGARHRLFPPEPAPLDDAGLAHKVESVLFRDPSVPKGRISVNAELGTVYLRGELESAEQIDDVVHAAEGIVGVEVVSLLHTPGTPAPHPAGARLVS